MLCVDWLQLQDDFLLCNSDGLLIEELEWRLKNKADRERRKAEQNDQDGDAGLSVKGEKWKPMHMEMATSRYVLRLIIDLITGYDHNCQTETVRLGKYHILYIVIAIISYHNTVNNINGYYYHHHHHHLLLSLLLLLVPTTHYLLTTNY